LFAPDVHRVLAFLSLLAMGSVAVEGGVRAALDRPAGQWASRLTGLLLVLIGLTAAAGLALLVDGYRPRELLHFVYALLAFGIVPAADSISARWPQRRRALARGIGSLVGLGVILRLYGTG